MKCFFIPLICLFPYLYSSWGVMDYDAPEVAKASSDKASSELCMALTDRAEADNFASESVISQVRIKRDV
jgi:hypothetical protein